MKRFLASALATLMLVSMAGCGSKTGGNASTPQNAGGSTAAEATTETTTETNNEAETATEETTTADATQSSSEFPDPNNKVKFSFFADVTWLEYDSLDDGIIPNEVERLTGVSFDMTKSTDSEQLNLLIASGDLPDVIMVGSSAKLNKLSDPDLCYPLDELISQYTPSWQIPETVKLLNANYSKDGKYYMLKNEFNTIDEILSSDTNGPNFGQLHMRDDIYKEIGSPKVNSKNDFINMLKSVKEKYPDMIPLVLNMREYSGLAQFVGYDPYMPKDASGNFVYSLSSPKYRDYLKLLYELAQNDLILDENFAYTSDEQTMQYVNNGKAFMVSHYAGNDEQRFTANVQKAVPEASFVQLPLTDAWNYTIGVSGWSGFFISRKNKDPETAIKFLHWAKQPENQIVTKLGVEGTDWEKIGDGGFKLLDRPKNALEAGTFPSDFKEIGFLISATDYIRESTYFYDAATDATKQIFMDATKKANWSNIVDLCYPKADTDERVIYNNLESLVEEYIPRVALAKDEAEFNKIYDEMLAEAEKIGIQSVNDYRTTTYKEMSEKLKTK